jgi:Na+/H+-translocating membrane pyrophosphatase
MTKVRVVDKEVIRDRINELDSIIDDISSNKSTISSFLIGFSALYVVIIIFFDEKSNIVAINSSSKFYFCVMIFLFIITILLFIVQFYYTNLRKKNYNLLLNRK